MGKKNWFKGLQIIVLCSLLIFTWGCHKKETKQVSEQETNQGSEGKSEQKSEQEQAAAEPEQVTMPNFTAEQIAKFEVRTDGETKYSLAYFPREDRQNFLYWDMSVPYDSTAIVDTEAMYKVFQTIAGIKWKQAEQVKKSEDTGIADAKKSITVAYVKEDKVENSTKPGEKATLFVGNDNGDGKYYCAFEGAEDKVFLVDSYLLDAALNQTPYNLILKIPYLVDIRTVKSVTVEMDGKTVQLDQKEDTYRINGKKADKEDYQKIYSQLLLSGITKEYTGEEPDGEQELAITYTRTKKEFEDYKVVFYAYDDKNDAVQVNGKTYFLVGKEDVATIKQSLLDHAVK